MNKSLDDHNLDTLALQKLFNKLTVYKFLGNLTTRFSRISHTKISIKAGRAQNNFNRAFNENEDIRLSTLLRYWRAIDQLVKDSQLTVADDRPFTFESLLDEELLNILDTVNQLSDIDWNEVARTEHFQHFIHGLEFYVSLLTKKGLLLTEEIEAFKILVHQVKNKGGSNND